VNNEYATLELIKRGVESFKRLSDDGITVRVRYDGQDRLEDLVKNLVHRFDALELHLASFHKEFLMAKTDMLAALAKIDTATNNIAADIKALKDKIGTGMSDADVAEVQGILDSTATKLEAIAADTPDA
jgi:SMC interacting uncharacterized protein involved in chromosome segregation